MSIHHLATLTWPAFRDLASARLIAVLPLGAIEAHGPHLPLGTDVVIAEAMAQAGAEQLAARGFTVVLLPVLPVAPAPFAAAFAGTIDISPSATTETLVGLARSLGRHGVRAMVIANAHHDPAHIAAIREAVARVHDECPNLVIFPDVTRRRWASRLTEEFQSGACHAGRYETSIVLAETPRDVALDVMSSLAPNPRSLVTAIARGDRSFDEAGGPDAYFGAPAEASGDEGREIIQRLGGILADAVLEALATDADRQSS